MAEKFEKKQPPTPIVETSTMKVGGEYDDVKLVFIHPTGHEVGYDPAGFAIIPLGVTAYFALKKAEYVWHSIDHFHGVASILGPIKFKIKNPDKGLFA